MRSGIRPLAVLFLLFLSFSAAKAQILTHEDSLAAGLDIKGTRNTAISGYGEARYSHYLATNQAEARLERMVLFIGHKFNPRITLFTELELENGRITADGKPSGELAMEQAFLKFDLSRNTYITAGLFIPRIGIINENHLPTTFNGVMRPVTETILIPATWREVGVGLYGSMPFMPNLNYSVALVNGLNAAGFNVATGIREGRYEGTSASARNKAVTGALLYYLGGLRLQTSAYAGGSVGLSDPMATRLNLNTGFFGTPVYLNEANAQYRIKGLTLKALVCRISIPDAARINAAFANNTPTQMQGGYVEAGYNVLETIKPGKQLIVFSRFEHLDMNAELPENGIANEAYTQNHVISGLSFLPAPGVVVKADYHYTHTGDFNQSLILNPDPLALPYRTEQHRFNLGIGYSF